MKIPRYFRAMIYTSALWLASPASAQLQPQSAHVNLYFPQVADGAFAGGRWQTAFSFVNANPVAVDLTLELFDDFGRPLVVDLGAGLNSKHSLTVPAEGALNLSSLPVNQTVNVGWARAFADLPLSASSSFRLWLGGKASQEVTAQPVLPVLNYIAYANRELGVALANPFDRLLPVNLYYRANSMPQELGPVRVLLQPHGHASFNVKDKFPAATFEDSVVRIEGVNQPEDMFLAWTMNADSSGTFSSQPPGGANYPLSHWDRIWNVYLRVEQAAVDLGVISTRPRLTILSDKVVNAFAAQGTDVAVTLGLSQLINDSDSEMAIVLAHELGHIYQQTTGRLEFNENAELDADVLGTFINIVAGYDPYAAAGTLAKLSMATGTAALTTQFEQQLSGEAHESFNTRLQNVYEALVFACSLDADFQKLCAGYKKVFHPNLPDAAPLSSPVWEQKGYRAQTLPLRERLRPSEAASRAGQNVQQESALREPGKR